MKRISINLKGDVMRITINDVAKEAGVSITTVSRVINGNYPVKIETRAKVEETIKKLKFKPNSMARSLITRKTSMIGVVVPGLTNLFFSTVVESVERYLKIHGYSISLCNTSGDPGMEIDIVEELIARQNDGIIVIDPSIGNLNNGFYDDISKSIPLVVVNGGTDHHRCNTVSYNEEIGTQEAFEYLIKLGHKRIALLRGDKSHSYDIKEQLYYKMIMKNEFSYSKILYAGNGNSIDVVANAQNVLQTILSNSSGPTAIFACNDLMAIGAINACRNIGLRVPEDISIIGFDNTLLSQISSPKLTSVDLNIKQVGEKSAMELLDIISTGFHLNRKVIMDTSLVVRESCGPLK